MCKDTAAVTGTARYRTLRVAREAPCCRDASFNNNNNNGQSYIIVGSWAA